MRAVAVEARRRAVAARRAGARPARRRLSGRRRRGRRRERLRVPGVARRAQWLAVQRGARRARGRAPRGGGNGVELVLGGTGTRRRRTGGRSSAVRRMRVLTGGRAMALVARRERRRHGSRSGHIAGLPPPLCLCLGGRGVSLPVRAGAPRVSRAVGDLASRRGGGRRRAAAVPCCACARPCSLARRSWVARWAVSLARRSCSCSPAASPEGSPGLRGTAPSWGRPWSCVCSASVPTCPPARKGGRSPCLPRGSAWTRGCWCDGGCSPAVVKDSTEVRTRTGITFHGAGRRRHRARTHGGKSATYRKWEHLGRGNRSSRSEPHRDAPAWQRLHPSRLANPRDQPRGRPS